MEAFSCQVNYNEENIWSQVGTTTLTPNQIEIEEIEDQDDRYTFVSPRPLNLAVLVSCDLENDRPARERKCQVRKFLWRGSSTMELSESHNTNAIVIESSEDQLVTNTSEYVASLGGFGPEIWEQVEAKVSEFRGVYSPTYKRNVIFSETVTFKTSELPRWKPNSIIGKHNVEEDYA